jgi:hypothetical protein
MSDSVKPDCIFEVAAIFARGFLRYRKPRRLLLPDPPQNGLDSGAEPSRHVSVVNAERTDEN